MPDFCLLDLVYQVSSSSLVALHDFTLVSAVLICLILFTLLRLDYSYASFRDSERFLCPGWGYMLAHFT